SSSTVAIASAAGQAPANPLATVRRLVEAASESGAEFVVLPEYAFGADVTKRNPASRDSPAAQPIPGPTTRAIGEIAGRASVWVSYSMLEDASPNTYVTSVLTSDEGRIVARYRKRTLAPGASEASITPGFARELFDTVARDETRVGVASGNDVLTAIPRFASRGANIVLVNASWPASGRVDWRRRIRTLSERHNVAVVVSDLSGNGSGVYLPRSGTVSERACAACEERGFSLVEFDVPGHRWRVQHPLGLPEVPIPSDLPFSPAIVELGRTLFFEPRLSRTGEVACASCHDPNLAFSDGRQTGTGTLQRRTRRNVPSLLNAAYRGMLNWDGNPTTIEQQIKYPLMGAAEFDIRSERMLRDRLRTIGALDELQRIHGIEDIGFPEIARTLGAYIRTLVSAGSAFDRYYYGGEVEAMRPAARKGLDLFRSEFDCAGCHTIGETHALFADDRFHRLGVGYDARSGYYDDPGVGMVSNRDYDGMFFTPSLRNVARTGPYMHDGSVADLAGAVRIHYAATDIRKRSSLSRPPPTEEELGYLVAFLEALDGGPAGPSEIRVDDVVAGSRPAAAERR
ncbi:MAG: hypothetical protein MJA32_00440, partial [Proteobacteria bacterium]|nr:hypothetical protein [Pseudomonadota bacterium]